MSPTKLLHSLPFIGFIAFVLLKKYIVHDEAAFDIIEKTVAFVIIYYYYKVDINYAVAVASFIGIYFAIEFFYFKANHLLYDNQSNTMTNNIGKLINRCKQLILGPSIPKIIIQTWKNKDIPKQYWEHIQTVKNHNPDYEYKYFTDEDIEQFLRKEYPQYYETYRKLPVKIQKIDFFRYVAVYHYGGFYFDLDMTGLEPLNDLLGYDCVFPVDEIISPQMCRFYRYKPFCDKGYRFLLGQYAFAARAKHPFIKELIESIHANVNDYIKVVDKSEQYVYSTTGPDFVTNIYINYANKSQVHILNNNMRQFFGNYAKHNYFGTWK